MRTLCVFLLVLMAPFALGAELSGTIYDDELRIAQNVLVTIDTVPAQRILAQGEYHFTLPQGNYTLLATYQSGNLNYTSREEITISEDGAFVYDLFLFPGLDEEEYDTILDDDLFLDETYVADPTEPTAIFFRLVMVVLAFGFFFFVWQRLPKKVMGDDDLVLRILTLLQKNGGRMLQKELRAQLPQSEAAVSLALSDLENQGRIEKIKKGRGNIIKLK